MLPFHRLKANRRRALHIQSTVDTHDATKALAFIDVVSGPARFHTELHLDYEYLDKPAVAREGIADGK